MSPGMAAPQERAVGFRGGFRHQPSWLVSSGLKEAEQERERVPPVPGHQLAGGSLPKDFWWGWLCTSTNFWWGWLCTGTHCPPGPRWLHPHRAASECPSLPGGGGAWGPPGRLLSPYDALLGWETCRGGGSGFLPAAGGPGSSQVWGLCRAGPPPRPPVPTPLASLTSSPDATILG